MLYIIAYDVSDNGLRVKLANLLKNWGGERIQYSAFKLELNAEELAQLLAEAKQLLAGSKARLVAIPLCKRDEERSITLTNRYELPLDDELI